MSRPRARCQKPTARKASPSPQQKFQNPMKKGKECTNGKTASDAHQPRAPGGSTVRNESGKRSVYPVSTSFSATPGEKTCSSGTRRSCVSQFGCAPQFTR